jgi:hypothetical protein
MSLLSRYLAMTGKYTDRSTNSPLIKHKLHRNWHIQQFFNCCLLNAAGNRSRGPGSIPGATRFSENQLGLERGPLSLVSTTEELLGRKISGFNLEKPRIRPWPCDTLYSQKIALTSPTSGGRSVPSTSTKKIMFIFNSRNFHSFEEYGYLLVRLFRSMKTVHKAKCVSQKQYSHYFIYKSYQRIHSKPPNISLCFIKWISINMTVWLVYDIYCWK